MYVDSSGAPAWWHELDSARLLGSGIEARVAIACLRFVFWCVFVFIGVLAFSRVGFGSSVCDVK